ncbi:GNAT family N-acetyltransferase [Flavivirga eckloniae]|uniref:Sugar acetyltransferase n=1 Tax=Flavivirga eckloniae TaxID=1803846 RepID=A0A2K9PJK1_9FLAO|nr:GNAT family N-acetyltransferase [Flavivirga eckloniae]AUP77243.1 sugar acetyltransferase [Flavivirga eckloniae]
MELVINKILNEEDFELYLKTVESFDIINPFYKLLASNIEELLNDKLRYFTLKNDDGEVLVLMPFILRKVPYLEDGQVYYDVISPYGYSGPLFNQDMSRGHLITFWKLVDEWYKANNIISEFVRFSLNHNFQFYSGVLIPTLSNVRGAILDEETQWSNLKQKVRTNYRKGASNELRADIVDGVKPEDVERFYRIYISTMKRVNADTDYFYSLDYFKNIARLSKGKILITFIYKDDTPISTELILISGNTLYSYLGGTLMDFFNLRPNDFLKVEVMKWARKRNFKYYNLGGGRVDFDSLYSYKKSFFPNDEDVIFYTGRKIIDKEVYDKLDKIMNAEVYLEKEEVMEEENDSKISFFPAYRRNAFNR